MSEQSLHPLKVALLVLGVIAVIVLVFSALTQKSVPVAETTTAPSTTSKTTSAPTSSIPMTEIQKEFKAIQDKVNAGTLSTAEAKKQMDALVTQLPPPPPPPEIQKQIDAAKKK